MRKRRATRQVRAGSLAIGGDAPVSIQSMTNVPIEQVEETIAQIGRLAAAGCQLVRLALRSAESADLLKKIVPASPVPLCADVHFDHRIALAALAAGVHKVRINPGNIGSEAGVREVVAAARIGVNAGSVDRRRFPEATPEALVESAMEHVRILEDNSFGDIVVSIKSSGIPKTMAANELFAAASDYPLHVGLTEAGYGLACAVQSSVAIGHLLLEGIGDTIRVSMTGDPVGEIPVARQILESAGARKPRVRVVSCPTCGRTDPDLDILALAKEVDEAVTARFEKIMAERDGTLHVAVMGCEVNGPGEAKDADAGLAGIRGGKLLLFAKGEKVKTVNARDAVAELVREIGKLLGQ